MPWGHYRGMTDEDLKAMFAYLRQVPAVKNKVPDPLPPAVRAAQSAYQSLLKARDLPEVMKLHSDYVQSQMRALAEQATAIAIGERDALHGVPFHLGQAIVFRERVVGVGVVGIEEVEDGAVLLDDVLEEQLRLAFECLTQRVIVVGIRERVRQHLVDVAETMDRYGRLQLHKHPTHGLVLHALDVGDVPDDADDPGHRVEADQARALVPQPQGRRGVLRRMMTWKFATSL